MSIAFMSLRYNTPYDASGGSRSSDTNPSYGDAPRSNGEKMSLSLTRSPSAPADLPVGQGNPFRSLTMACEPSEECRRYSPSPVSPPVVIRMTDKSSSLPFCGDDFDRLLAGADDSMMHPLTSGTSALFPPHSKPRVDACIDGACPGWRPPTNISRASLRQVESLIKKV